MRITSRLGRTAALLLAIAVAPAGPARAEDPSRFAAAWESYKESFLQPDGRILDSANKGVSHTEGQGYGMLFAVKANDDVAFLRIWGWTKSTFYNRVDGLGSWRYDPADPRHVADLNNATDGDLLIAWALVRAGRRWASPEFTDVGRRIAEAVGRSATFPSRFGLMLKPGASGFGPSEMADGPVVNLSYWVFPAFPDLASVTPKVDWAAIREGGLSVLAASRFGAAELPTDWISLRQQPRPAAGFPPTFSYNAVRVPLYLVWAGLGGQARLDPFLRLGTDLRAVDVATGKAGDLLADAGYRAVMSLAACSLGRQPSEPSGLADFVDGQPYYSSSLQLLSFMAKDEIGMSCR